MKTDEAVQAVSDTINGKRREGNKKIFKTTTETASGPLDV